MEVEIFETSDDESGSPIAPAGGAAAREAADETFEEEGSAVEGEEIDPLAAFETFMGRSFDPSEGESAAALPHEPSGGFVRMVATSFVVLGPLKVVARGSGRGWPGNSCELAPGLSEALLQGCSSLRSQDHQARIWAHRGSLRIPSSRRPQ